MVLTGTVLLKRLDLRDIYSYRNLNFSFPEGFTALVGPNGSGKTSVMESIILGLMPRATSRGARGIIERIPVRRGAKRGRVSLALDVGGTEVEVNAEIVVKDEMNAYRFSVVTLRVGGKLRATGPDRVLNELVDFLGLRGVPNLAGFISTSVYLRQGALLEIAERLGRRGEFKGLIDAALGITRIREAIDRFSGIPFTVKVPAQDCLEEVVEETAALGITKVLERSKNYMVLLEDAARLENKARMVAREAERLAEEVKRIEQEIEGLKKTVERLRELRGKESELAAGVRSLEEEIRKEEERASDYRKRIQAKKKELEEVEARAKDLERIIQLASHAWLADRYIELRGLKAELETEAMKLREALDILRGLEKSKRDFEEYVRLEAEKSKLEEKLRTLDSKVSELRRDIDRARRIIHDILRRASSIGISARSPREAIAEAERKLEETARLLEELRKDRQVREERIGALRGELKEKQDALAILERSERPECPVCGRPLEGEARNRLASELKASIAYLQRESTRLNRELAALKEEEKRLEREQRRLELFLDFARREVEGVEDLLTAHGVASIEEASSLLTRLEMERKNVEKRLADIKGELGRVRRGYANYQFLLDKARKLGLLNKDPAEIEAKLTGVEEKLDIVKRELGEIGDNLLEVTGASSVEEALEVLKKAREQATKAAEIREAAKRLKEEIAVYNEEVSGILGRMKELKAKRDELVRSLESVRRDISALEGVEGELEVKLRRSAELRHLVEAKRRESGCLKARARVKSLLADRFVVAYAVLRMLEYLADNVHEQAIPLIVDEMNEILDRFPLPNLSRVDYDRGSDALVAYDRQGNRADLTSLSGGEKSVVAIAFALAFSKVVGSRIGFLILDEPTAMLDDANRRVLMEVLGSLAREGSVRQLIISTHHGDVVDMADQSCIVSFTPERGSEVKCEW